MKKSTITAIIITTGLFLSSCEVTDFDFQNNPDELTPEAVSPDFMLNEVQVAFGQVMKTISLNTDDVMRYEAMSDTYADIAEPSSLNGEWDDMYEFRANVKIIEDLASNDDALLFHRGAAKILHAYGMATLADYLGDIPFSQANIEGVFNPEADDDAFIYESLITDIDLAITDMNNARFRPQLDIYYGDSETVQEQASKWVKLANSLKLKLYINIGATDEINSLVSSNNFIDSAVSDFQFQYSKAIIPESRHPYFLRAYLPDGQSQYMGNYFLWLLKDTKTVQDPRLRYYIYRQTNLDPTGSFDRCSTSSIHDFCYVGDFYWGRDHGDNQTRPADAFLKAVYGIYPGGGAFDDDSAVAGTRADHMGGAGMYPILLASYVDFLKAEAVVSLGANGGDPAVLLEAGIRKSMDKVLNFESIDSPLVATQLDVDAYVDEVLEEFSLASSSDERLDIIIREYYLAAYGNSIEAYNAYRRTGFPSNIQIPIQAENIPFPRTFSMPEDAVSRNGSLSQRPITNQVFWDTNPEGFIN